MQAAAGDDRTILIATYFDHPLCCPYQVDLSDPVAVPRNTTLLGVGPLIPARAEGTFAQSLFATLPGAAALSANLPPEEPEYALVVPRDMDSWTAAPELGCDGHGHRREKFCSQVKTFVQSGSFAGVVPIVLVVRQGQDTGYVDRATEFFRAWSEVDGSLDARLELI